MADTEKRKEQPRWAMREEEPPRRINEGEGAPGVVGAEVAPSVQEYNPDDPRERRLRQLRDMYKGDINKDMLKSLHRRVEKVEPRQEQPMDEPNERLERNETPRSIFDEAKGAK